MFDLPPTPLHLNRVTLHLLELPLVRPFRTAQGRLAARRLLLVEAEINDVIGWGECVAFESPFYTSETIETARHILRDFLVPSVQRAVLQTPAQVQTCFGGVRGHPMAKAALEMALWDAFGKLQGRSLASMLGGVRSRVEVGVAVGMEENPEDLLRLVEGYRAEGYRRIKLKIKPGRDVQVVETVRRAFPDLPLQVDANAAYTRRSAERLLPLDDYALLLIEQPLPDDDLVGHARLQARLRTPLCLDESIASPAQARQALELGACRVLNIKPGRVGGLKAAVEIHEVCREKGLPAWCGGMLESGVGRAANLALAALPGFTLPGDISATERYYREDIIREPFVLADDGTLSVPVGAGLGVVVERRRLQRYRLQHEVIAG